MEYAPGVARTALVRALNRRATRKRYADMLGGLLSSWCRFVTSSVLIVAFVSGMAAHAEAGEVRNLAPGISSMCGRETKTSVNPLIVCGWFSTITCSLWMPIFHGAHARFFLRSSVDTHERIRTFLSIDESGIVRYQVNSAVVSCEADDPVAFGETVGRVRAARRV